MKIEPTTERLIAENFQSTEESYLLYLMHVATYKYSLDFLVQKKVLDYGCGSGYGTALVSSKCSQIIGVDVSSDAIMYASTHFSASNLSYMKILPAEDGHLPFLDACFDVVLSFQVIEHVVDVSAYLREIERVLLPGGIVLIATPDRSSRLFLFQKPWNMWHLREYTQGQLHKALANLFSDIKLMKIGGNKDILAIELNRTKKLRWLLLPVTLPFIPELVRRTLLRFIKSIKYVMSNSSNNNKQIKPDFDESVFSISEYEKISVSLLAIARKNKK